MGGERLSPRTDGFSPSNGLPSSVGARFPHLQAEAKKRPRCLITFARSSVAAYVVGVFWLTRMAAKRVSLTASKRKLALYAIAVGGVMFNLIVFRTAAAMLEEPFALALFAAVGFGTIAMFFALLTA